MTGNADWICCQLGAREHYAVPRALHRENRLKLMVTDAWLRPGNLLSQIPHDLAQRLGERCHADLETAPVHDLTRSLLTHELEWRLRGRQDWDLVMERNRWFQREAAAVVAGAEPSDVHPTVVFAYSNSAREVFRTARERGCITVLGQIDAGAQHFRIVRDLAEASPQYGPPPAAPPDRYFEEWREECALSDHIVVNSEWSRRAVAAAGVDEQKISVFPLAYEPAVSAPAQRSLPDRFTRERPLRLLFAGSVSVVKGAPVLLEAMALLGDLPVSLTLVGAMAMTIPDWAARHPSIQFTGAVPRSALAGHYRASDVLMFPSHSDGFGIVQLEAQAHGLPIIASTHCGRVVAEGVNGWLLPEVTADAVAQQVRQLVTQPRLIGEFSRQALRDERSTLPQLGRALLDLVQTR